MADSPLNPDNLRVVLVSPRNPLNIGAAARAMSNFGFLHLRLVNPYDVAFRESRAAVNAAAVLQAAQEYKTVPEAIADCEYVVGTAGIAHRELQHTVLRLEAGARGMRKRLASGRVALLFGSEKFGLSNDDMSYCHALIRIPTREAHESMNLGQSVAVCLYEIVRKSRAAAPEPRAFASSADLDRVTHLLAEALRSSGYIHSDSTEMKIRRLVRRMNLATHDAEVLHGMVRQILWKLSRDR